MKTYVIRFWNRGQTEEYDGGHTIAEARKEAASFKAHMPGTEIRICELKGEKYDKRPYLVEVA